MSSRCPRSAVPRDEGPFAEDPRARPIEEVGPAAVGPPAQRGSTPGTEPANATTTTTHRIVAQFRARPAAGAVVAEGRDDRGVPAAAGAAGARPTPPGVMRVRALMASLQSALAWKRLSIGHFPDTSGFTSCCCDICNWCDGRDDCCRRDQAPTRPTRRDLRKFLIDRMSRAVRQRRSGRVAARRAPEHRSKPLMRRQIDGQRPSQGRAEHGFVARRPHWRVLYTLAFWRNNQGVGLAFVTQRGYGRRRWLVR
jgi:hypothetical protein